MRDGAFRFPRRPARRRAGRAAARARRRRRGATTTTTTCARVPRHGYVAFYLWLRAQGIDALVHIGAHGTLEWLPGKSVALSDDCWPEALIGATAGDLSLHRQRPRRGRAGQAADRGGHARPPAAAACGLGDARRAGAAGSAARRILHRRRARSRAPRPADRRHPRRGAGARASRTTWACRTDATAAEAITRIDRFVCDVKESQFGDGLHVFGSGARGEARAGRAAGGAWRAGSWRRVRRARPIAGGRTCCRPGATSIAVDPRAVPSRGAHAQGVKLAEELLRRHLQDHGDWPRGLVVDLWGIGHDAHGGRGIRDGAASGGARARAGTTGRERVIGVRDRAAGAAGPARAST